MVKFFCFKAPLEFAHGVFLVFRFCVTSHAFPFLNATIFPVSRKWSSSDAQILKESSKKARNREGVRMAGQG